MLFYVPEGQQEQSEWFAKLCMYRLEWWILLASHCRLKFWLRQPCIVFASFAAQTFKSFGLLAKPFLKKAVRFLAIVDIWLRDWQRFYDTNMLPDIYCWYINYASSIFAQCMRYFMCTNETCSCLKMIVGYISTSGSIHSQFISPCLWLPDLNQK